MKYFEDNPYRLLGLTIDATEDQISEQLLHYESDCKATMQFADTVSFTDFNDMPKVLDSRTVKTSLYNIQNCLTYAQFWFSDPTKSLDFRKVKSVKNLRSLLLSSISAHSGNQNANTDYWDANNALSVEEHHNLFLCNLLAERSSKLHEDLDEMQLRHILAYLDNCCTYNSNLQLYGHLTTDSQLIDSEITKRNYALYLLDRIYLQMEIDPTYAQSLIDDKFISQEWRNYLKSIVSLYTWHEKLGELVTLNKTYNTNNIYFKFQRITDDIMKQEIWDLKIVGGYLRERIANEIMEFLRRRHLQSGITFTVRDDIKKFMHAATKNNKVLALQYKQIEPMPTVGQAK